MKGAVGSLNAAVAGSILLFEALAQREDATDAPSPAEAAPPDGGTEETAPAVEPPPTPRRRRAAAKAQAANVATDVAPSPKPRRRRAPAKTLADAPAPEAVDASPEAPGEDLLPSD